MPGCNGKELASRLRPIRPDMRVLFMSGYDDNVLSRQGIQNGEVNYLPKPFSPKILAAKVREVLGMPR
jgi:DNA-binding response OmpR family regulator